MIISKTFLEKTLPLKLLYTKTMKHLKISLNCNDRGCLTPK